MMDVNELRVIAYKTTRVDNPYPGGELPWQVYHTVRNAVVRACRAHGPTGPMGELKIAEGVGDLYQWLGREGVKPWPRGDAKPDYYIIPDQYNHERFIYGELCGEDPFREEWLVAVAAALGEYGGWGLGIGNIPESYLLIFGDRLMKLAACRSAREVVCTASQLLKESNEP